MTSKITQLNVIELKDGIRVAVTYSVYKEDGSLYSNNNKISYKIKDDEILKEHISNVFAYLIEKIEAKHLYKN